MKRRDFIYTTLGGLAAGMLPHGSILGQTPAPSPSPIPAPVKPEFRMLRRGVGCFTGRGGTIGYYIGKDGLVAVDSQFPDTAKMFLDGLPDRGGRSFDFLINTHHHFDHTAGNKVLKDVSKQIVAHENVPGLQKSAAALNNSEAEQVYAETLFPKEWKGTVGDETIHARYYGPGHTGGDAIIHFEKADVVHLGDLYFNRIYPAIDRRGGASIKGWISILEKAPKDFGKDTLFIAGHGKPEFGINPKLADLPILRDYFTALLEFTEKQMKAGKTKEEVMATDDLPGFPDFRAPKPNRLSANFDVAFQELSAGK